MGDVFGFVVDYVREDILHPEFDSVGSFFLESAVALGSAIVFAVWFMYAMGA